MSRRLRVALASSALLVAAAAPLATTVGQSAAAVTIDGARSLNDAVTVKYQTTSGPTTDIHVIGFNDFHGNIDPGTLNIYGKFAGGAAWLAKTVEGLQAANAGHEVTVQAGDNIGASPLQSGLFFDEPAEIVANLMHVDLGSVGNHEFDKGKDELKRMQNGGCKVPDGCTAAPYAQPDGTTTNVYPGADFEYLAANVIDNATGQPLFPAFAVKSFPNGSGGTTKVGFIGEVLQATPTIVTPTGVEGLTFLDETDAANSAAAALRAQGVNTIVLVIHQGGFQSGTATLNGCGGNLAGSDLEKVVTGKGPANTGGQPLDPSIGVIISGHTHAEYRCTLTSGGATRLITSAASFGRIVTDATLTVDDATGQLATASANNVIVQNSSNASGGGATPLLDLPKDERVAQVVQQYDVASAPLANKVIGKVTADISNKANSLGEIASGDTIADAQLEATKAADLGGAVIAFMNPGGIRGGDTSGFLFNQISGTEAPGEITYGEAFNVQPFGNSLVTKTMTGAQIRALLEQQFVGCTGLAGEPAQLSTKILQISAGLSWEENASAGDCAGKVGAIKLNGQPIDPSGTYRVTMNNFLATGGDGFTVFNHGTSALGGAQDIDALTDYFGSFAPGAIPQPPVNRVVPLANPVVPESSLPVLLPITGLLIVGAAGAFILLRRRRPAAV
jgi:5'-nucleotidase